MIGVRKRVRPYLRADAVEGGDAVEMIGMVVADDDQLDRLFGALADLADQLVGQCRRSQRIEHHHAIAGDHEPGIGDETLVARVASSARPARSSCAARPCAPSSARGWGPRVRVVAPRGRCRSTRPRQAARPALPPGGRPGSGDTRIIRLANESGHVGRQARARADGTSGRFPPRPRWHRPRWPSSRPSRRPCRTCRRRSACRPGAGR